MNIPVNLQEIITLFYSAGLNYNLFKCEHILEGENKNLDLLFKTTADYHRAGQLLGSKGFALVFSEEFELYKQMYVRFSQGSFTAIHLHREISWHGLKALNKEHLFNHAREIAANVFVPSNEDSLIIHVAHILFENFRIRERDAKAMGYYLQQNLDWSYINLVLEKEHLKNDFYYVKTLYEQKLQPDKAKLYASLLKHILRQKSSLLPLAKKLARKAGKKLLVKRGGCLITLIGVNGSGKTTLASRLGETYRPLTNFLSGQESYYFGWRPVSVLSKIASGTLKKANIRLYDNFNRGDLFLNKGDHLSKNSNAAGKANAEINSSETKINSNATEANPETKPGVLENLFYLCNYFEYLWRYYRNISSPLRKKKLVITDRYFYDLYGQYRNARNSRLLKCLIRLFPKPDYVFILNAPVQALMSRAKQPITSMPDKQSSARSVHPEQALQDQIKRFNELGRMINARIISTITPAEDNIGQIISLTWRDYSLRAGF